MNRKLFYSIATILLIVGIVGGLLTFSSSKETVAQKETIAEEDIEQLDLHSSNMKVHVAPTSEEDIVVELSGTESAQSDYNFQTKVEDHKLHVETKDKNWRLFEFGPFHTSLKLTIHVPEKQYSLVRLTTDNGRITVNDIQAEDVELEADNGKVEGENLETSSFHAKADNGTLTLSNIEGSIEAGVNNGTINVTTQDMERSMDLETDNGKITVHSEKEPENVTFLTNVDNGSVSIFGGKYDESDVIGNGDHVVKLTTNNGKIKVTH